MRVPSCQRFGVDYSDDDRNFSLPGCCSLRPHLKRLDAAEAAIFSPVATLSRAPGFDPLSFNSSAVPAFLFAPAYLFVLPIRGCGFIRLALRLAALVRRFRPVAHFARSLMAQFNAITLEKNAIKREKIERRRGPKPARVSLLWAQTLWLEARVALSNGRVLFQSEARTWNLDGALLETTKRALDKLASRPLSPEEIERLNSRKRQWTLWRRCASLENFSTADLGARFVLESLLNAPLGASPARELSRLSLQQQNAILSELEEFALPEQTRDLMRWVVRNRGCAFWRNNPAFPVNLACRLGFEGDAIPPLFQNEGVLALNVAGIVALLEEYSPTHTREIAQFWCEARWEWPSIRPLRAFLKSPFSAELGRAWRELEQKWRSQWLMLWREMALGDLGAAMSALQFHELLVDENFSQWRDTIHKPKARANLLVWFEARNTKAFELMEMLRGQPDAASLIELMSELWLEYSDVQTDEFWHGVLVPTLHAALMVGAVSARELRAEGYLPLTRRFAGKPDLLQLALEWARRGEGTEWAWKLSQLPSTAPNAALLRREAELCFALYDQFPDIGTEARRELWEEVLNDDSKRALAPLYWRFVRALTPLFLQKVQAWHDDNASNLRDWLVLWAGVACDLNWKESEMVEFCGMMLSVMERELKVVEEAPSRLDSIERPLETFVQLSHWAGETPEQARKRCEVLLQWLTHGKTNRVEEWWDALDFARKLLHHPRFAEALLLVAKRSPAFVREILPQIESLRRLHLTAEFDAIEDEMALPEGELGDLVIRFPRLETSIAMLGEWQRRAGEAPAIPSGICELLRREEKWQREAEFLRARLTKELHDHLQIRLVNLEARLESGLADVEVELASALETAVEAAISSGLRSLVRRAMRGRLRFLCGPVAEALEWNDDWANALLIACELHSNRKWATKLLRGQSQNSSGWQRHIPANQKWLGEFAASGKNREFFESEYRAHIGEWELWIERDALQILQMGNRFSTCLSRGGCNSHSTIANALDANKLVVYARRDGHIQARQLWAVTDAGKLGGFHIYANLSEAARKKSGLGDAFCEFACRFAHECGLELLEFQEYANIEIPEICGAQWYDDGLVSWHQLKNTVEKLASRAPGASPSAVGGKTKGASAPRNKGPRKTSFSWPPQKISKIFIEAIDNGLLTH